MAVNDLGLVPSEAVSSALFLFLSKKGIICHIQHALTLLPVGARGNTPSDKVKPKQAEHAMIALPDFKRMRVEYQLAATQYTKAQS